MNILVSGSSGLVGSALVPALGRAGHSVRKLVRRQPGGDDEVRWDPAGGTIDVYHNGHLHGNPYYHH